MKILRFLLSAVFVLFCFSGADAQKLNLEQVAQALKKPAARRSAILEMEKLKIPVLILHGEKDEKTPVRQAYLLRDRLTELEKEFEIKIYPDWGHVLDTRDVIAATADFLRRKLNIQGRERKNFSFSKICESDKKSL